MPAPRNVNTMVTDSGGGKGNKPKSPYAPQYYQQQPEWQRQAQLIAQAQQRAAEQQAAALARQRQQQLVQQSLANQQNLQSTLSMEPTAPTWRSPIQQQPQPSLQNTLSMEPVAPTYHSPLTRRTGQYTSPTLQNTLSMEPTAPPITYQAYTPFTDTGLRTQPPKFSWAYNMPTMSNVSPPAYTNFIQQGGITTRSFAAQQPSRTQQFTSPTVVPTSNAPTQYSGWTWEPFSRRDAYGNLVPYGPINEGWEFTDIPTNGYGSGGGWGGYGGYGGGYNQESSAPFYRGNYTQSKSRWNETLLTWGLRQE